ncbi:MAG: hypothetical protein WBP64_09450 [Nitrososphaeraceae archaeon]|jgi:hypothetical protein
MKKLPVDSRLPIAPEAIFNFSFNFVDHRQGQANLTPAFRIKYMIIKPIGKGQVERFGLFYSSNIVTSIPIL